MPRRLLTTLVTLVLTLVASLVTATSTVGSAEATDGAIFRVRGADRVATAAAAARTAWGEASTVLIATSEDYPDAVAASAFASSLNSPLLLTPHDEVPPVVTEVLEDLGTRTVTVLGGAKAISDDVVLQLRKQGLVVDRLAGASRWDTAKLLAERVAQRGAVDVVALALGDRADDRDAWPDALAAASLAGLDRPVPTLLTRRGALPTQTREALADLRPSKVLVLGGESAISDSVMTELGQLGIQAERLDGPNRFATSVAVAAEAMNGPGARHGELTANRLVVVSGEGFADALGAGALAARLEAPLVLSPSGRLADSVDAFIRTEATDFQRIFVVGGTSAINDFVAEELHAAIHGDPRPAPPCPPNSSPDCQYTYRHPIETWEDLAECESHQTWDLNTGNGYYGGLQFSLGTWQNVGGQGYPHQNSKWEQIHRGEILQERSGWGQWPHCSRELGLR